MKKQFMKPNNWTETEKQFLTDNYLCKTKKELSQVLGRTEMAIRNEIRKLDLETKYSKWRLRKCDKIYKGGKYITGAELSYYKQGAKRRNLQFFIGLSNKEIIEYVEDIYIKQNYRCILTGRKIYFNTTINNGNGKILYGNASVDRIDNEKGYIKNNIQIISKDINRMKWDLNLDYFKTLCYDVVNYG